VLFLLVPLLAACSIGPLTSGAEEATPVSAAREQEQPEGQVEPTEPPAQDAPADEQSAETNPPLVSSAPQQEGTAAPPSDAVPAPPAVATASARGGGPQDLLDVPSVVETVRPGVVKVIAGSGQGVGTGSGFVIDRQGHIVTNNHVVESAAQSRGAIHVLLSDNKIERVELVGRDPESDLAVVRMQPRGVPPMRLGDSSKLRIGEEVVAIGSALGLEGDPTVSTGVVSAVGRTVEEPGDPNTGGAIALYDLIQTDTAINPGNSGGPLLNLRGEVVGVNTLGQRATQSGVPVQGVNYAVSVNTVKNVSRDLIATGEAIYPYIGICSTFIYPEQVITQGLPPVTGQVIIPCQGGPGVAGGTPAEKAGLQEEDIITAIDGQEITNESAFVATLRQREPGDTITLTIRRGNETVEARLTLAERPRQRP
jgi:S1-C subfamily serine protease